MSQHQATWSPWGARRPWARWPGIVRHKPSEINEQINEKTIQRYSKSKFLKSPHKSIKTLFFHSNPLNFKLRYKSEMGSPVYPLRLATPWLSSFTTTGREEILDGLRLRVSGFDQKKVHLKNGKYMEIWWASGYGFYHVLPLYPMFGQSHFGKKQKGMKLGEEIGSKSARLGNSEGKNGSGSIRGWDFYRKSWDSPSTKWDRTELQTNRIVCSIGQDDGSGQPNLFQWKNHEKSSSRGSR